MLYRVLADAVVVTHLLFIAFVATGSVLAWRWPRLLRAHVVAVIWALAIVAIGFRCPLTTLEQALRERAGLASYGGGFIDHYVDGVLYPGRFTALARLAVAAVVTVGYVGVLRRRTDGLTRRSGAGG